MVRAGAGCGKTSTQVDGLRITMGMKPLIKFPPSDEQQAIFDELRKYPFQSCCCVAFNKSIAEHLKSLVPGGVYSSTFHSLCLRTLTGKYGDCVDVQGNKLQTWLKMRVPEILPEDADFDEERLTRNLVKRLIDLSKQTLTNGSDGEIEGIMDRFGIEFEGVRPDLALPLVREGLEFSLDESKGIIVDFNDMIWWVVKKKLQVRRFDLFCVDEFQDLNLLQHEAALMFGRRLFVIGDPKQAIYGFTGAETNSMFRMQERLEQSKQGITVLPLMTTRRCPKKVVELVKHIAPDFKAADEAPEGIVSRCSYQSCVTKIGVPEPENEEEIRAPRTGDLVVCRMNAPLVRTAIAFIKARQTVTLLGGEFGEKLVTLIKQTKARSIKKLGEALTEYLQEEEEKAEKKKSKSSLLLARDKVDCIRSFMERAQTVQDVIDEILDLFAGDEETDPMSVSIVFASIHRAKGLESKNVYFLFPEIVPHPLATQEWERQQEDHLYLVACTRSKHRLTFVTGYKQFMGIKQRRSSDDFDSE